MVKKGNLSSTKLLCTLENEINIYIQFKIRVKKL